MMVDIRQAPPCKRRRQNNLNDTETQQGASMMMITTLASSQARTAVAAASPAPPPAAYDSEEEPPVETIHDRLLWRCDPDESKSDWTIEIIVKNSKTPEKKNDGFQHDDFVDNDNAVVEDTATTAVSVVVHTYHVHVRDLTVGPRRSEYFVQMLRDGGRFVESHTKSSRIELHAVAAEAFPMLLDFCYSSERDDQVAFTTANATALYSLANYFGIRRLSYLAKQFWKTDMKKSVDAGETYYVHAAMLQEEKVLQAATRVCKDNIMKLSTSSRLLHIAYVDFWMDIAKDFDPDDSLVAMPPQYSLHLSKLMDHFFQQNNTVETDVFLKLTSNAFLPQIHKDAAISLLDAERRILSTNNNNSNNNNDNSMNHHQDATQMSSSTAAAADLTNLQERCMESIVSNWKDLDLDDEDSSPTMQLLYQQSPLFLARLFARIVSTAKQAVATTTNRNWQMPLLYSPATSITSSDAASVNTRHSSNSSSSSISSNRVSSVSSGSSISWL